MVRPSRQRRLLRASLLLALALVHLPTGATAQARPPAQPSGSLPAQAGGRIEMKLRRLPDAVELVIEGVGTMPQLQQTTRGGDWEGMLWLDQPGGLRRGPQSLTLPEAGFRSFSISGSGRDYRLQVSPMPGAAVPRPVVSADGRDLILSFSAPSQPRLQTAQPSLTLPGAVPQSSFVPPLQPRAVAPPLGDIAVGTMMLANPSYLNVSGPPVTMTLRNAPARDVLMALSQQGGYGFAWIDDNSPAQITRQTQLGPAGTSAGATQTESIAVPQGVLPVTVSFRRESYSRAINTVLLAANLQGKLEGNTIFAGPRVLSKTLGSTMSKVFRLNQVSANAAADYLANLGAVVTKVNTITTAVTEGSSQTSAIAGAPNSATTTSSTTRTVEAYGSGQGPLQGLLGTTDTRLSTITLVGDPRVVAVAESYLRQLDLRQRQVALSVRILDVTLDNDSAISNSFAFRYGNNFIVSDRGQLLGAFGRYLPPRQDGFTNATLEQINATDQQSATSGQTSTQGLTQGTTQGTTSGSSNSLTNTTTGGITTSSGTSSATNDSTSSSTSGTSANNDSTQGGSRNSSLNTTSSGSRRINPGQFYPGDNFFNFLQAMIVSSSTKVLASPTLILTDNPERLREGSDSTVLSPSLSGGGGGGGGGGGVIGRSRANEGYVTVGDQVITNYSVQAGQNGAPTTCQPQFGVAGLTFGARVNKIDDNGFVTFSISPTITATTRQQQVPNCGPIDILAIRSLDSGGARVRDGQTLIMTGVISDLDSQLVRKWPILGDLPLIGQFFRDTTGTRRKRELVILVTPRIVRDDQGGAYGYGYQPETPQSRDFLLQGGG